MTNALPFKIKEPVLAFPDSGHHVKFIPLFAYDESNEASIHERLNLTENAKLFSAEHFKLLRQISDDPNSSHENFLKDAPAWVRVWVGSQERILAKRNDDEADLKAKLVGVWIGIESNLGTRGRGYVTRISSPPVQTEVEAYEKQKHFETPYAYEKVADTRGDELNFVVSLPRKWSESNLDLCTFSVVWLKPDGEKPISVDVIVDFGNTRTAVLALEHIVDSPSLAPICKPIPFQSTDAEFIGFNGFDYDQGQVLTDSWFLLKQPRFEGIPSLTDETPDWSFVVEKQMQRKGLMGFKKEVAVRRLEKVTYRIPHMFVEMSPALMGASARKELLKLNLSHGAKYFMSSPKRYAWDTDPVESEGGQNWHMVPEDSTKLSGVVSELPNLDCQLLRFMAADGSDWTLENPPTEWPQQRRPVRNPMNPKYPRSDALAWTALTILENAYRTINSVPWRDGNRPFGARKLRRIIVTYPSGWTAAEIDAYRSKWQRAINVFMLTRLPNASQDEIKLVMTLDEAVASQLPIVVAEIRRLGNDGHRWLNVVGLGKDASAMARVMTVDIGGGTTDISVVEYHDELLGAGVDLKASVLFKDSSTVAGDHLRKMVIERVLLPRVLGNKGNLDQQTFESFLSGVQISMAGYAKWARYTRVIFLPIVNRWLSDLVLNSTEEFTISALFQTDEDGQVLDQFNEDARNAIGVDLINLMDPLSLRNYKSHVEQCIVECFDKPFRALSKHVAAFGCDMVIVSGKPSELPPIRRILEEHLPILPNRLIFAKGFRAGGANWPLSKDGRVHDAKFVTVVGAALAQAIQSSLIKGWSLKVSQDERMLTKNWWGVPDDNRLYPIILDSEQDDNTVKIKIGQSIGRKLLPGDSSPEPVYVLRWKEKHRRGGPSPTIEVSFRRTPPKTAGAGEALSIVRAKGVVEEDQPDGRVKQTMITEKDVELKLCTMQQGDQYWLDTGRFEVVWPETNS